MGDGMISQFDADITAIHLLRHGSGGAGAEKAIKNQVAGVGGDG